MIASQPMLVCTIPGAYGVIAPPLGAAFGVRSLSVSFRTVKARFPDVELLLEAVRFVAMFLSFLKNRCRSMCNRRANRYAAPFRKESTESAETEWY